MKENKFLTYMNLLDDRYIEEADPAASAAPVVTTTRRLRAWRRIPVLAAAILLATLMVSILGMTISAEEQEPALQEVPIMILKEDFDRLIVHKMDEIDAQKNTHSNIRHDHMRVKYFYEYWDLDNCKWEKNKEALLEQFPITELADIYVYDATATAEDKEWMIDQLRAIGFTQDDLIDCYENLYRVVKESDSENIEKILTTLPEIPEHPAQTE